MTTVLVLAEAISGVPNIHVLAVNIKNYFHERTVFVYCNLLSSKFPFVLANYSLFVEKYVNFCKGNCEAVQSHVFVRQGNLYYWKNYTTHML